MCHSRGPYDTASTLAQRWGAARDLRKRPVRAPVDSPSRCRDGPVHDRRHDPGRVGDEPPAAGGLVGDEAHARGAHGVGVEQHEVGRVAGQHPAAIGEAEQVGLIGGELADRVLEREHAAVRGPSAATSRPRNTSRCSTARARPRPTPRSSRPGARPCARAGRRRRSPCSGRTASRSRRRRRCRGARRRDGRSVPSRGRGRCDRRDPGGWATSAPRRAPTSPTRRASAPRGRLPRPVGGGPTRRLARRRTPAAPSAATAACRVGSARTSSPGMSSRVHSSKTRVEICGTTGASGRDRDAVSSSRSYPTPGSDHRSNTGPTTTGLPLASASRTCQSRSASRSARPWINARGAMVNSPGPGTSPRARATASSSSSPHTCPGSAPPPGP